MFDGVHLGHQAVIRQAVAAAGKPGHFSGVLTFDPHPSHVLHPENATAMLMPLPQRVGDMLALGVDQVLVQPFTIDYARRRAEDFVPFLRNAFPGLESLHVGENFRFGAGRGGDVTTLRGTAESLGLQVHALPRRRLDGDTISSSRIRAALVEGDVRTAGLMLGHPYVVDGRIVPGKGIGRQLDYPTLNVPWMPEARPRYGVYSVYLRRDGAEEILPGIANYGLRPTIGISVDPLLEVHLFASGDVPVEGDHVRVALVDFIRPEKTFPGVRALREQIREDVEKVRSHLSSGTDPGPPAF